MDGVCGLSRAPIGGEVPIKGKGPPHLCEEFLIQTDLCFPVLRTSNNTTECGRNFLLMEDLRMIESKLFDSEGGG